MNNFAPFLHPLRFSEDAGSYFRINSRFIQLTIIHCPRCHVHAFEFLSFWFAVAVGHSTVQLADELEFRDGLSTLDPCSPWREAPCSAVQRLHRRALSATKLRWDIGDFTGLSSLPGLGDRWKAYSYPYPHSQRGGGTRTRQDQAHKRI